MKQTVAVLQALMKSGWCARRKEASDAMMVNQNKGRTSVKAPSSVMEEQPPPSEAPMLSSIPLNYELNSDLETRIKNTTTSGHVDKPLSSKQRVPRVVRASTLLKSTSDTDKSTTAGSGDLTEDDCFRDSGSDLEIVGDKFGTLAATATRMTMPAFIAPPSCLAPLPPPGLEAPPGLEVEGIHKNLKAAPFAWAFSQNIAPSSAQKMSMSNESQGNKDNLASDPGKFAGAMQHLHESMAQLQGALAQWENCVANKDVPALKAAAQANADIQAARLFSEVSSVLGASSPPSMASMGQTLVLPNAACSGTAAPPWRAKASLEQKSCQRAYNLHNSSKQGRRHVNSTPAVHMTSKELSADSLRSNLQEVDNLPAERVIIVRKIANLGLESRILLKDHFAKYGVVEKVLASPTRVNKRHQPARLRPAGMGFIVMSSIEEATAILNFGPEQIINGAVITVHPCEARDGKVAKQEDKDQDKMFESQAGETKCMRFQ